MTQDIESLTAQLKAFLIEEHNAPLKAPAASSPIKALFDQVSELHIRYQKVVKESELQTLSEGVSELKRRGNMREISGTFEGTVGKVIAQLILRGDEVSQASDNALEAEADVAKSASEIETSIATVLDRASVSEATVAAATLRAEEAADLTKKLNVAGQEIVDVVNLIQSIAKQTDLLALNAGIEAARAGDVGRGFGVVAIEVKSLATRTTEAAQQVRKTVSEMRELTTGMTASVEAIKEANVQVSESTMEVISAINQQAAATSDIGTKIASSEEQMLVARNRIDAIRTEAGNLHQQTGAFVSFISAEPGVNDQEVRFAQSAPLTGPVSSLGLGAKNGVELAFAVAAAKGGIHGRRPVLQSKDDAYNPEKALENVRQFVRSGEYLGLVGAVGTPTSKLSERIARGGRVPFVGPVTGTGFLREPERGHVVNVRASYGDETAALVEHFAQSHPLKDCAMLLQADAYGFSVRDVLSKELARKGGNIKYFAPYNRADGDVSAAVEIIKEAQPKLIFMAGTAKPTADFVSRARAAGITAAFATISFVGATEFARQVGPAGADVIVSQVVPIPEDQASPLSRAFMTDFKQFRASGVPDFAMLEGYLAGRVICEMLQLAGPNLTRDGFLSTLMARQTKLTIENFPLQYGPGDNAGSHAVFLTQLTQTGRYVPIAVRSSRIA